ncbi:MAG: hypothetical protein K5764_08540 [Prevotella sp.]|nr:hypothetical protein [Prevotella sp.]
MTRARTLYYCITLTALLLLTSCGEQHKASSMAEDFVENYALSPEKMTDREFADLDTTLLVSDSVLLKLRTTDDPLFKKGITYPTLTADRKHYFLRMRFQYEGEEMSRTFYFDGALKEIIAIK